MMENQILRAPLMVIEVDKRLAHAAVLSVCVSAINKGGSNAS